MMRNLIAVGLSALLVVCGLASLSACSGMMDKEAMIEKDKMMEKEKMMKKEKEMMEKEKAMTK